MAICKTEAVVIRSMALRESSKIVTLYTKDFGLLKGVIKGIRGPKARYGASLGTLSHVGIVFYRKENRDLQLITQVNLIDPLSGVKSDLTRLGWASAAVELLEGLLAGEESHPDLFSLLLEVLRAMGRSSEDELSSLFLSFALRSAAILGYAPRLDACVSCGRDFSEDLVLFLPERGGIICRECADTRQPHLSLSPMAVDLAQALLVSGTAAATQLKTSRVQRREIWRALRDFLDYHAVGHRRLKSLEFLRSTLSTEEACLERPNPKQI